MDDNAHSDTLLQKLCDLQQQQLDKLDKLSEHLSEIAGQGRKNHDAYKAQLETYDRDRKASDERADSHRKWAVIRGFLIIVMLGLIAVAIIVAHFL
jgi:hypothetical protein